MFIMSRAPLIIGSKIQYRNIARLGLPVFPTDAQMCTHIGHAMRSALLEDFTSLCSTPRCTESFFRRAVERSRWQGLQRTVLVVIRRLGEGEDAETVPRSRLTLASYDMSKTLSEELDDDSES